MPKVFVPKRPPRITPLLIKNSIRNIKLPTVATHAVLSVHVFADAFKVLIKTASLPNGFNTVDASGSAQIFEVSFAFTIIIY